jgi:hypothetical protein
MEGFEQSDSGAYVASFEGVADAGEVAELAAQEVGLQLTAVPSESNNGYTYSRRFGGLGNSVRLRVTGDQVRVEATHAPMQEPSAVTKDTAQKVRSVLVELT